MADTPSIPRPALTPFKLFVKSVVLKSLQEAGSFPDDYPEDEEGQIKKLAKTENCKLTWENLPAEDKKTFGDLAREEKKRFQKEMVDYNHYNPTKENENGGDDGEDGELHIDTEEGPSRKKAKKEATKKGKAKSKKEKGANKDKPKPKKPKDPNAPKRPLTAYFIFMQENRSEMVQNNPGMKLTDLSKLGGQMWADMTPEDKAPYTVLALERKARYDEEMRQYNARLVAEEEAEAVDLVDIDEEEDEDEEEEYSNGVQLNKANRVAGVGVGVQTD